MKLIALAALAASLIFGQTAKPTPITDPAERLKIFDMFAEGQKLNEKAVDINNSIVLTEMGKQRAALTKQANDIQEKINQLNAKIQDTALGKELGEIDLQMNDLRKKFNDVSAPLLAAHNCAGGTIAQSLELKGCPAPVPVKVPDSPASSK